MLVACAILLIIKLPDLNLPAYWDEAFPYSYAIGYMVENNPGLLTTAAPAIHTTGHPLLYYFSQAVWNSLVGETLWMQRLFPLLLSMGCLWMTFLVGRQLVNARVGVWAAFLLVCQSTFLSQSGFQLPEVMLTFLMFTTIYTFLQRWKWLYTFSAGLMLLVKEPAVILLGIIFLYHLLIVMKGQTWSKRLSQIWMYALAVSPSVLFYLHQYAVQGWVLFPRHTGFMDFTFGHFANQLRGYFTHLFIYSGRNGLFFSAIVLVVYYVIKNRPQLRWSKTANPVLLLLMLLVGYLVFSSFNFYSNRYILCLFPLFSLLTAMAVYYALEKLEWVSNIGIVALCATCLYFSLTKTNPHDHSLGYADEVRCQQQAIDYAIEQGWKDKTISTSFLMSKNMSSHYPSYVNKEEVFTSISEDINQADIVIKCSNEKYFLNQTLPPDLKQVKNFKRGKAFCEVYAKVK